jgi:hypothetical protein
MLGIGVDVAPTNPSYCERPTFCTGRDFPPAKKVVCKVAAGISGLVDLLRLRAFSHSGRSWRGNSAIQPRLSSWRDTSYSGLG